MRIEQVYRIAGAESDLQLVTLKATNYTVSFVKRARHDL